MDDLYFHIKLFKPADEYVKFCSSCKHIDWRTMLVSYADEHYHNYDGSCFCENCKESGRSCISPYWKACEFYEAKTSDDYIFEMCDHILYALDEFAKDPNECEGKTRHEVVRNVLSNYIETVTRFLEDDEFEWMRKRKEKTDGE